MVYIISVLNRLQTRFCKKKGCGLEQSLFSKIAYFFIMALFLIFSSVMLLFCISSLSLPEMPAQCLNM